MRRSPSHHAPAALWAFFLLFSVPLIRLPVRVLPLWHAQAAEEFFEPSTVQDLRLSINSRDLATLRATYTENHHYPADLVWRNSRVRNVAVRSRGFDSRDPNKLGLQIDFDRYTPGQRFLGLQSLSLDNFRRDPSMMREPLAMSLYRQLDQTVPRETFARLFINNVYEGLYAAIENYDLPFLQRTFGRSDGYLFEYKWLQPYYGQYPGDDLVVYKPLFEPRTNENAADDVLYGPIRGMLEMFNRPEDLAGQEDLDQFLDLKQFVTSLAVESFLGDEDGVAGCFGMNNFYLYRDANSTRHTLLVWDRDRAFNYMHASIFDRLDENVLTRRALAYDDLRERYLTALQGAARRAMDGDWLAQEIERLANLIRPAAYADAGKPFSNEEFEEAIAFLREWAAVRPALVLDQAAAARGAVHQRHHDPK